MTSRRSRWSKAGLWGRPNRWKTQRRRFNSPPCVDWNAGDSVSLAPGALVSGGPKGVDHPTCAADESVNGIDQGVQCCCGTHLHELCFVSQSFCLVFDVAAELPEFSDSAGIGQSGRFIHLADVSFGGMLHHFDLVESVAQLSLSGSIQHVELRLQGWKLNLSLLNVTLEPPLHVLGFCIHRIDFGLLAHAVFECTHTIGYCSRRELDSNPSETQAEVSHGRR